MTIKLQARALLRHHARAGGPGGDSARRPGRRGTRPPAAPATPALHGTRIALGATTNLFANAFAEAPNGTVFFARGAVVYVVRATRRR